MPDVIKALLDFGGIGLLAIILLYFSHGLLLREQKRADDEHAEVARLNALMADRTIPALLAATQAIAASQSIMQELQRRREVEEEVRTKNVGN